MVLIQGLLCGRVHALALGSNTWKFGSVHSVGASRRPRRFDGKGEHWLHACTAGVWQRTPPRGPFSCEFWNPFFLFYSAILMNLPAEAGPLHTLGNCMVCSNTLNHFNLGPIYDYSNEQLKRQITLFTILKVDHNDDGCKCFSCHLSCS